MSRSATTETITPIKEAYAETSLRHLQRLVRCRFLRVTIILLCPSCLVHKYCHPGHALRYDFTVFSQRNVRTHEKCANAFLSRRSRRPPCRSARFHQALVTLRFFYASLSFTWRRHGARGKRCDIAIQGAVIPTALLPSKEENARNVHNVLSRILDLRPIPSPGHQHKQNLSGVFP